MCDILNKKYNVSFIMQLLTDFLITIPDEKSLDHLASAIFDRSF